MKTRILVSIIAFVLVHAYGAFIYFLSGMPVERCYHMGLWAFYTCCMSALVAAFINVSWQDLKEGMEKKKIENKPKVKTSDNTERIQHIE